MGSGFLWACKLKRNPSDGLLEQEGQVTCSKESNIWYFCLPGYWPLVIIITSQSQHPWFFTGGRKTCWHISSEPPSCPCSSGCRWRGSVWGWLRCTSLRSLSPLRRRRRRQNWGTCLTLSRRIRKWPLGETHRWKMFCTSPPLSTLSIWRK